MKIKCPVCGSEQVINIGNNLSLCTSCTHVFQTDLKVTMEYNKNYIDTSYNPTQHPIQEMAFLRAGYVLSKLDRKDTDEFEKDPINVLDIGYGSGVFLKAVAKLARVAIYGLDIHKHDRGIKEVDFKTKIKFDIVTFFDSLEHFPNFDEIFKLDAKMMLVSLPKRPETFFESPTTWKHYKPGEHLHYFSNQSLATLMKCYGYEFDSESDLEDTLRGKCNHGGQIQQNISTSVYRKA